MVFLVIVVLLVLFILADILIRNIMKYYKTKHERTEREKVLQESLKFDYSSEANTLKRVEVEKPKAKILCVDDEEIILDSFRKILVLDGYTVETVESGKEAVGLIQRGHYDFVFTDLKMPEMSGEEVAKAVKHLRPDIDVVIITGYATVESAVECMQYGAMDYIQKPFTDDELLAKTKECLIKRRETIKASLKPSIHISHADEEKEDEKGSYDFSIPGGVFISKDHVWLNIEQPGNAKVGVDDFARKIIGNIDSVEFPNLGMEVYAGQNLFNIAVGGRKLAFASPISGKVIKINNNLKNEVDNLNVTTYSSNWICEIDSENLDAELNDLNIGKAAVSFYRDEIDELNYFLKEIHKKEDLVNKKAYSDIVRELDDADFETLKKKLFAKA